MRTHILAVLLATCAASAQTLQTHAVFPQFENKDATSCRYFAGLQGAFRQQIVLLESRLQGLKGKTLRGFSFRRDTTLGEALKGGQVRFAVHLAVGPATLENLSETFGNNHQKAAVKVFDGVVVIPDAPAVTGTHQPWASNASVDVNFSTGYAYQGGTLCIDVVGIPVTGKEPSFWWVDFEWDQGQGRATPLGRSCSPHADVNGHSAYAHPPTLRIGSSSRVQCVATPGASVLLFVSPQTYVDGLDLSSIGAPGCRQYVAMHITLPPMTCFAGGGGVPFGFVDLGFQIPNLPALMGASVAFQAANFLPAAQKVNAGGLTTSNGVLLTFAGQVPSLGVAMVTSDRFTDPKKIPATGAVEFMAAPVLRMRYE